MHVHSICTATWKIVNIYEKTKVDIDLCLAFSLQLPLETVLAPTSNWQITLYRYGSEFSIDAEVWGANPGRHVGGTTKILKGGTSYLCVLRSNFRAEGPSGAYSVVPRFLKNLGTPWTLQLRVQSSQQPLETRLDAFQRRCRHFGQDQLFALMATWTKFQGHPARSLEAILANFL